MTLRQTRRRAAAFAAAFAFLGLVLAPAVAEARAGGRVSSGSRGAQTYQAPPATQTAPGGAQQFNRTQTAPGTPAAAPGAATAAPRPATPAPAGGFFARNPLMAGLMGGLLGAGLFGLLAGSGFFGGLAGFAGFMGFLLQIALIAGLVWLVLRLVRGSRQPAVAGAPNAMARDAGHGPGPGGRPQLGGGAMGSPRGMGGMGMGAGAAAAAAPATRPIEIGAEDYDTFGRMLVEVQEAWSRGDMAELRRLSTPEMTTYFEQDLADLKARGWTSVSKDTRLEAGDLSEAWAEQAGEYATVAMRFSLIDVTTDATGKVVEGHPTERETVTEMWTFFRRPGTRWVLSAIQQTG